MKHTYFTIILVAISLFFWECKTSTLSSKKVSSEEKKEPVKTNYAAPASSQILFINYKIKINSKTKETEAFFINKVLADGKLKRPTASAAAKKNNLKFSLIDDNQVELKTINIANPLIQNVEYVGNDGKLGRKNFKIDSATISIRIQLPINTFSAKLEQINTPNKILINSKIKN